VTQLPEALAATWGPGAASCEGEVIGSQARTKGINLVHAPTVTIVRVPQWSRTFESLGEDAYLTGLMASAEVDGIQGSGTMVKHYAVYAPETYRNTAVDNATVGDKTLQEIYLRAWDQTVDRAQPASIMCSYATVNGTAACQNAALIRGHLDGTLHFPGFVGSDYYATHSTVPSVEAGLDQEQPLAAYLGPALVTAPIEFGDLHSAHIRRAALS